MIEHEVRTLERQLGEVRSQRDQYANALMHIKLEHDRLKEKYNTLKEDNRDLNRENWDLNREIRNICSERDKYRACFHVTLGISIPIIAGLYFTLIGG